MTTRTKLALCAGLLAVGVGVVMALRPPTNPTVEVKFIRYTNIGVDTWVVLGITNHGAATVVTSFRAGSVLETNSAVAINGLLPGRGGTQFLARSWLAQATLWYWPDGTFHIGLASARSDTGTVVSVALPPRETNAPAQPVTP